MIKRISIYLLFLLVPFLSFSQWNKLGNNILGDVGDKLGTINSIAMDASGQTLVVGSPFNSDNGAFSGVARVYDWDGTDWVLRTTIKGVLPETEGTGDAVDLSADGQTLALGISYGRNALDYRCGIVQVLDWDGTEWQLRGASIEGEGSSSPLFETDVFGSAVSLNADGNFLVVGASGNTPQIGELQISGHARVFEWNGTQWVQMGADIDGETGLELFGASVDINDAGNVVAISGRDRNIFAADSSLIQGAGYVRVFEWDGLAWNQIGDSFFGTGLGERLGASISLNSEGNSLVIGAPNNASLTNPGSAKVFDWNGTNWTQRGQSIIGDLLGQTGSSVDISGNGNVVAVGEPWANSVYGQVRVFEWKNNTWEQVDGAIADAGPPNSINAVGSAVRLSADGSIVTVGASSFDTGSFSQQGLVNTFKNETIVNLEDSHIADISYFPNPTTNTLHIESTDIIEGIEVFSSAGKSVYSTRINTTNFLLEMSTLPAGSYYVKVQSQDKTQVIKVSKI